MPPGAPFESFALPYRIRIDAFSTPSSESSLPSAQLHLLTHTHTDHITGLSAPSFASKVICTSDAKNMLLRHEVYAERELLANDMRAQKTRTFRHLKVAPVVGPDGLLVYTGSRDLLDVIEMNKTRDFELEDGEIVKITAVDANHCPGAVMYLIEGTRGNILHTGDFRAEPWFLDSLTRNPFLQLYLARAEDNDERQNVVKTLDAIYLDTACVFSTADAPTKQRATDGLVELVKLFPPTTYFFINAWTWGYEDILKAVAQGFNSKIHVDRYKHNVLTSISDPFLRSILTTEPHETRFHACERFDRCSYVACDDNGKEYSYTSREGKHVVYVNPVTMDEKKWDSYLYETKLKLLNGEQVNNLLVPLSRHSPLPELRQFVSLFRPKRIIPNTLDPKLGGLDWVVIDRMFRDCLHPTKRSNAIPRPIVDRQVLSQMRTRLVVRGGEKEEEREEGYIALSNLVGEGAEQVAEKWKGERKKIKMEILGEWMEGEEERRMLKEVFSGGVVGKDTAGSSKGSTSVVQSVTKVKKESSLANVQLLSSSPAPAEVQPSTTRAITKTTAPSTSHVKRKSSRPIRTRVHRTSSPPAGAAHSSQATTNYDSSDDERGRTAHLLFAEMSGLDPEDVNGKRWWASASPNSQPQQRMLVTPVSSPIKPPLLPGGGDRHTDTPLLSLGGSSSTKNKRKYPVSVDSPPQRQPEASTSAMKLQRPPPLPFTPISKPQRPTSVKRQRDTDTDATTGAKAAIGKNSPLAGGPLASPFRLVEKIGMGTGGEDKDMHSKSLKAKGKEKASPARVQKRNQEVVEEEIVLVAHHRKRPAPARNKSEYRSRKPMPAPIPVRDRRKEKGKMKEADKQEEEEEKGHIEVRNSSSPIWIPNPRGPTTLSPRRRTGKSQIQAPPAAMAGTAARIVDEVEERPRKKARIHESTEKAADATALPAQSRDGTVAPSGVTAEAGSSNPSRPRYTTVGGRLTPTSSEPLIEVGNIERGMEKEKGRSPKSSSLQEKTEKDPFPAKPLARGFSQSFIGDDILSSSSFLINSKRQDGHPRSLSKSNHSPSKAERSIQILSERRNLRAAMNSARLKVGEKLAKERPDLVVRGYEGRRRKLERREEKYASLSYDSLSMGGPGRTGRREGERKDWEDWRTVYDEGETTDARGVDWERSRFIADTIREAVKVGKRPEVPELVCAKSQ